MITRVWNSQLNVPTQHRKLNQTQAPLVFSTPFYSSRLNALFDRFLCITFFFLFFTHFKATGLKKSFLLLTARWTTYKCLFKQTKAHDKNHHSQPSECAASPNWVLPLAVGGAAFIARSQKFPIPFELHQLPSQGRCQLRWCTNWSPQHVFWGHV